MNASEFFWNASTEELKRGYIEEDSHYICLLCGKKYEKGIIYQDEGTLYEAHRYVLLHIEKVHTSVFDYLINLNKRFTGLTDHQNSLLKLFYQGKGDAEIQKEMDIGSASTIRNHRFALKEKERQSRVFLTLMELLKDKDSHEPAFVSLHKTASMVDGRYNVTREENEKTLKKYFPKGTDGPLKTFSMKEKFKLVVLREIVKRFEDGRIYSEKQVNEILKEVYEDFVTLRRYLIEYGFLDRKPDGSQYWVKQESSKKGESKVDRKELKRQYKESENESGVYQIKNTKNQRVFIGSSLNLKSLNGRKFELNLGGHLNKELQKEWNEYGEDAFAFEVLEVLEKKDNEYFDTAGELKKLEEKWLDKIQPYGERGYNKPKSDKI